jgi:hypothetical protein
MKIFLYTALTCALATVAFAQNHPDFSGFWKMDASRSKIPNSSDQVSRMTRRVRQYRTVVAITEMQSLNGKENELDRKLSTDGSKLTAELAFPQGIIPLVPRYRELSMTSYGLWEGEKLVSDTMFSSGEKATLHEAWTMSDDGQTWTDEMTWNGMPARLVFSKQ